MPTDSVSPETRRKGRAARQHARQGDAHRGPAFLTRSIPPYELLSEEGLASVEAHSDRILAEVGIEIRGDDEALRLFEAAGATVRGALVRFDPVYHTHFKCNARLIADCPALLGFVRDVAQVPGATPVWLKFAGVQALVLWQLSQEAVVGT